MCSKLPPTGDEKIHIELPGARANKTIPQRKIDYGVKLKALLDEYDTCLIATVTNVGSKQIAEMRKDFRGRARFLFGKNTLIRKCIRDYVKEKGNAKLMKLMDVVRGNCGFIFTKEPVAALRKEIVARKKQCAAKTGAVAPVDVFVEPGPTGMEPTQTAFFQAMNIPTRINRGQIDIEERVHIIREGDKVGASEASLLIKLGIRPFYYGVKVVKVYEDGKCYDAKILDITTDQIAQSFHTGLRRISALCFELNYPTIVNVPHSVLNVYKETLALGLSLDTYSWDGLKTVQTILENPEAFMAASGGAAQATGGGGAAAVAAKEPTPEPSESSEKAANPFGGDDSSSDDDDESD
jgi:large subunit ribosomal protein LP0